jgi:hypothetical protein
VKQVPSALQAQSGARGPSRVTRKPCLHCATDTLHISNVCHECDRGGIQAGDVFGATFARRNAAEIAMARGRKRGNAMSRRANRG